MRLYSNRRLFLAVQLHCTDCGKLQHIHTHTTNCFAISCHSACPHHTYTHTHSPSLSISISVTGVRSHVIYSLRVFLFLFSDSVLNLSLPWQWQQLPLFSPSSLLYIEAATNQPVSSYRFHLPLTRPLLNECVLLNLLFSIKHMCPLSRPNFRLFLSNSFIFSCSPKTCVRQHLISFLSGMCHVSPVVLWFSFLFNRIFCITSKRAILYPWSSFTFILVKQVFDFWSAITTLAICIRHSYINIFCLKFLWFDNESDRKDQKSKNVLNMPDQYNLIPILFKRCRLKVRSNCF